MAKLLIITKAIPQGHLVQTVVEFPGVQYAEDAIESLSNARNAAFGTGVAIGVIRLYDTNKGGE